MYDDGVDRVHDLEAILNELEEEVTVSRHATRNLASNPRTHSSTRRRQKQFAVTKSERSRRATWRS
jgi:hypothetical protein